ncbi:MAG: TlpA family protein disulfide reductase [Planctomycetaceae bacterium]|nr:TlpA family protein disulfide reductase [Planctomycetaceae bacterium]
MLWISRLRVQSGSRIEGTMAMNVRWNAALLAGLFLGTAICGCGEESGGTEPSAETSSGTGESSSSSQQESPPDHPLVTASISPESQKTADQTQAAQPVDEVTALLQEIQQLRVAPIPQDLEEAKATRRKRNEDIVLKAMHAIRLTMDDESRLQQFHQAIGQFLEARFQLALSGTQEDIDQLFADVDLLNQRDPKSIAAAEGVYYIAKLAHTKAGLYGKSQPEWIETFSRWAREFGDRFPEQQQRAVTLLFGAARSCELQSLAAEDPELATRLMTEARLCYTTLASSFGSTPQGQDATAVLRRMALDGKKLSQFSGPTLDGGFVSADEFQGKPTLIYFWDSESEEFQESWVPLLKQIKEKVPASKLRLVGVPLDDEEIEIEKMLEAASAPGQQIFFTNPEQRSWDSPLIRFWGVTRSPSVWFVDSDGIVVSTSVEPRQVPAMLSKYISRSE